MRLSLAQRQPANAKLNLAADDMTHVRFNHASVILLNIKNINLYLYIFLSFSSGLQKSDGARAPSL